MTAEAPAAVGAGEWSAPHRPGGAPGARRSRARGGGGGRRGPAPQPVELAASELVVAVGDLLQQGRHHGRAAAVIKDDLRRRLAERLGLDPAAPPAHVADVAAARTGLDRQRVRDLVTPGPSGGDDELVAVAAGASAITEELTRVR